jgi:hypothetical protein
MSAPLLPAALAVVPSSTPSGASIFRCANASAEHGAVARRRPPIAPSDRRRDGASVADVIDPVSWLQIEQGWNVVASDDLVVGTVAQVEGDKQSDIFDGLAVESGQPNLIRYVPAEQVGMIYPGKVTLKITFGGRGRQPGAVLCVTTGDEVDSGKGSTRSPAIAVAGRKALAAASD